MPDRATRRAIALIVLLIVVAAALRGYLPGGRPTTSPEPVVNSAVSLAFIVALLAMSLTVILIAVIGRLRQPRVAAPDAGRLPDGLAGGVGRPSWRVVLVGLALITAWLLLTALSTHLLQRGAGGHTAPAGSSTSAPSGVSTPTQPTKGPKLPSDHSGHLLPYLSASTILLLALLIGATVITSRRRPQEAATSNSDADVGPTPAEPLGPQFLARAAERGLAEIGDLSREPREAIIACYAAMERELARIPGSAPQDFDTPTEVLARAVAHHALSAPNATQLVNLFAEARFSPHVMNEQHREVAYNALQLVLAELSAQAGGSV